MYQRKVDVDMLNAVKSMLADVSEVSPSSEHIHINLTLIHCTSKKKKKKKAWRCRVCVYSYMYVCIYICMYVCMYVCNIYCMSAHKSDRMW